MQASEIVETSVRLAQFQIPKGIIASIINRVEYGARYMVQIADGYNEYTNHYTRLYERHNFESGPQKDWQGYVCIGPKLSWTKNRQFYKNDTQLHYLCGSRCNRVNKWKPQPK